MSLHIAGSGWVTPLGSHTNEVWRQLLNGDTAEVSKVTDPLGARPYPVYRVPPAALQHLPPHPRLRRASAISRFAAAAGLAALSDAKLSPNDLDPEKLALVFAVANGGVIYTKRFYADIVTTGAEAASPLLFPETVFNAAASHLAAILGLSGTTYTVVGDGSVGLTGLRMGEDLMSDPNLDYCLIVAAEEADWLLCDAYAKWRLLRSAGPVELFTEPPKGMILSEGAGAVLLSRTGSIEIAASIGGVPFKTRHEASSALCRMLKRIDAPEDAVIVSSANGTFVDAAEAASLQKVTPNGLMYSPKAALGEGVGAGGLWQVIIGALALQYGELPTPQYPKRADPLPHRSIRLEGRNQVTVLSCGLGQQIGAARLTRSQS
jgi:3-oxoacyl-[acyl-carrier-protein] synthase II